jgi:hypothetical protein
MFQRGVVPERWFTTRVAIGWRGVPVSRVRLLAALVRASVLRLLLSPGSVISSSSLQGGTRYRCSAPLCLTQSRKVVDAARGRQPAASDGAISTGKEASSARKLLYIKVVANLVSD